MPILNKLEYLDETKQQIKNALNTKFNSQITDENTFRSYVDKITNIYTNWPKVQGEGTNITLNNTKKARLATELNGDLSQETTTGKNLIKIDLTGTPDKVGGLDFTYKDNSFTLKGTSTGSFRILNMNYIPNIVSGKTYTISADVNGTCPNIQIRLRCYDSSNTLLYDLLTNTSMNYVRTLTANFEGTIDHCSFTIENIALNNFYDMELINLQIEEGSTKTNFEPYTGNQPSPSTDYPQEIKVATGNQNIKVINKNLNPTPSDRTSANVTFTCKDTTLTINGTNNSYLYGPYVPITLPAGTYTLCYKYISGTVQDNLFQINVTPSQTLTPVYASLVKSLTNYTSNSSTTFTLTESQTVRVFLYTGNASRTFNNLKIDIQLVKGTEADYNMEAHQEQTYPLSLGSLEFAKIGDYKDYIYRENGK